MMPREIKLSTNDQQNSSKSYSLLNISFSIRFIKFRVSLRILSVIVVVMQSHELQLKS